MDSVRKCPGKCPDSSRLLTGLPHCLVPFLRRRQGSFMELGEGSVLRHVKSRWISCRLFGDFVTLTVPPWLGLEGRISSAPRGVLDHLLAYLLGNCMVDISHPLRTLNDGDNQITLDSKILWNSMKILVTHPFSSLIRELCSKLRKTVNLTRYRADADIAITQWITQALADGQSGRVILTLYQ